MATLRTSTTLAQAFGTTASGTLASLVVGDLVTLSLRERDGVTPSSVVSDLDGALTFRQERGSGAGEHIRLYDLIVATAGSHVITVTYGGNSVFSGYLDAWISATSWTAFDQTNDAANSSVTTYTCGSITTTGAGVIVVGAVFASGIDTSVAGAGFTSAATLDRHLRQYKLSTGAETTDGPFTTATANTANAAIMNYIEAADGVSIAWFRA